MNKQWKTSKNYFEDSVFYKSGRSSFYKIGGFCFQKTRAMD